MEDVWAAYNSMMNTQGSDVQANNRTELSTAPPAQIKIIEYEIDEDDIDDQNLEKLIKAGESNIDIQPIRSVHETPTHLLEVGEIPDSLLPTDVLIPIGVVSKQVGPLAIIESNGTAVTPGSLISDIDRNPVTRVLDLFGPIEKPNFIIKARIEVGTPLFAVQRESEIPNPYKMWEKFKGCDASNCFDEPVDDNEACFSDDEMEHEAKGKRKQRRAAPIAAISKEIDWGYQR